jgi:hypothetical protein
MSGTREQRTLLALSMLLDDATTSDYWDELFSFHLNWPWIFMQAMKHKVVCLLWDNLKARKLVDAALRSGITRRWITYAEQLGHANLERNLLWLEQVERVFAALSRSGLPIVCLKGGALIGDLYHPGNRMLGDVDVMIPRDAVTDVDRRLGELGFRHGVVDHVTSTLRPMAPEKQRFWTFHNHLLPKFYLETGNPRTPFFKFSVGFDFFDPGDRFSVPSEHVVARRVAKRGGGSVSVPDDADMVLSLCAHVYREAVSASFAFVGDDWGLWKICDLRTFVLSRRGTQLESAVAERVRALGVEQPHYFSFHYAHALYGDEFLRQWRDLVDPGPDQSFLSELVDGSRRLPYDRPFADRFFDTGQVVLPGLEPTWYKFVSDDEW